MSDPTPNVPENVDDMEEGKQYLLGTVAPGSVISFTDDCDVIITHPDHPAKTIRNNKIVVIEPHERPHSDQSNSSST